MSEKPIPSKLPRNPSATVKAGRGNLGGSTAEAALAEIAIMQGRPPLLADGDARNPGLSAFKSIYERYGLTRPKNEDAGVLREWFSEAFGTAAEQKSLFLSMSVAGIGHLNSGRKRKELSLWRRVLVSKSPACSCAGPSPEMSITSNAFGKANSSARSELCWYLTTGLCPWDTTRTELLLA